MIWNEKKKQSSVLNSSLSETALGALTEHPTMYKIVVFFVVVEFVLL